MESVAGTPVSDKSKDSTEVTAGDVSDAAMALADQIASLEAAVHRQLEVFDEVRAQRDALLTVCRQIEREGEARVHIAPDLRHALVAAIVKAERR